MRLAWNSSNQAMSSSLTVWSVTLRYTVSKVFLVNGLASGHCDTKTYLNNPGESVPTKCLVVFTELQSSPVSSIFAK